MAAKRKPREDDLFDQVDVPAAVVCALCGNAECPGCANELSRSGVVAIVPWERPGAPLATRLWMTARSATFDAERFFETLPDGPVAPALRFAIVSELCAAAAMIALGVPIAIAVSPSWARHMMFDQTASVARIVTLAVPALAALLVGAHAVHGFSLARSASGRASRGLRFGLYSAGWDLVLGPLGAVIVAVKDGLRSMLKLGVIAIGLPARSARAFLRGAYRLEGKPAESAMRTSRAVALLATLLGAGVMLAAAIVALLV
jgi:hypothetical protein